MKLLKRVNILNLTEKDYVKLSSVEKKAKKNFGA